MKIIRIVLILFISTLSVSVADKTKKVHQNLNADKSKSLIENYNKSTNKLIIIDVRTQEEYEKGHLSNAKLIDFFDDDFEKKIKALDKKLPYLIHCQSGGRSMKAFKLMKTLGFEKVFHLDGGILAWKSSGNRLED
jgi:rhodanese-related sulfurtransferase